MADQKANLSETNSTLPVSTLVLSQQPYQPPVDTGNSESASPLSQPLLPPPENQQDSIHLVRASIPSPLLDHPGTERVLSHMLNTSSQLQSCSHPPNTPPQFHHVNSWPSSHESPSSHQMSQFRHFSSLPNDIESNNQQQPTALPNEIQSMQQQKPQTIGSSSSLKVPGAAKRNLASTASNLAYLLPTGTVLAFQTLIPSLSNSGKCQATNVFLVGSVIAFCAITCFLCSFTDSFLDPGDNQKVYYGIATVNSFYVFEEQENVKHLLKYYKIRFVDIVHAFGSVIVFLVFAFCTTEVIDCFFPGEGEKEYSVMVVYLPLLAGIVSTVCFSILPVKRQGIGYGFLTSRHDDAPPSIPRDNAS